MGSSTDSTRPSCGQERRVSFKRTVGVRQVLHLNDFTAAEHYKCWYSHDDIQRFNVDLKLTVRLMELGDLPYDTKDYCRRGTEYLTHKGLQRRVQNKLNSRNAVFDEQDAQWDRGVFDADAIAEVYRKASEHCLKAARILALGDQLHSNELHMETGKLYKPTEKIEAPKTQITTGSPRRCVPLCNAAA